MNRRMLLVGSPPGTVRASLIERHLEGVAAVTSAPDSHPPEGYGDVAGVVLDGAAEAWSDLAVDELRAAVAAGAALLVTGRGLPAAVRLGLVRVVGTLPEAEYVVRGASPDDPLLRRLDPERFLRDPAVELEPGAGLRPLLVAGVGYRDRVLGAAGTLGVGPVIVVGLGLTDEAAADPLLRTLLRRAAAPLPASRPVRVGIVGYGPFGGMGYRHGLAIRATPGLELVAIADPVAERRAAAAADFPGLHVHTGAAELGADADVDLAIVATPPAHHAALCADLLRSGRHVVCEKPLCLSTRDADDLLDLARAGGLVLTVHQNRRFDTDFLLLRKAVDSGLLGELFNVETFVGSFQHPCRAWHSDVALSGGAVYDWGSHHVDWILQLMGATPASVSMTAHKRVWHDVSNDDQLRLRLAFADGREAEFIQSDVAAVRRPKFYLQGTRGTAVGWYRELVTERVEPGRGYSRSVEHHAEAPVDVRCVRYEGAGMLSETLLRPAPESPFAFHRNLADHFELAEPLAVSPESARAVIAVLEAGTLSAAAGGKPIIPR